MEKIVFPDVAALATGDDFVAKQMKAKAGEAMPQHLANLESILFIYEGECILRMNNEEILLSPGEAVVIPPGVKHQIKAATHYKGIHFMPVGIKFEFFKNNAIDRF